MGENNKAKKVGNKIGTGVLFVAACFAAMYILMEFHGDMLLVGIAAVLLLISAFLFLNALFTEKAQQWSKLQEEEETPSNGDGEFRRKITKYMKDMESTQNEMLDVLKKQNSILQTQIDNLEHEIYMLSEKQITQTKTVIKYNKENARQLAISERETLEHVLYEIRKAMEENRSPVAAQNVVAEAAPAAEFFMEEVPESELFVMPELPDDSEYEETDIEQLLDYMEQEMAEEPDGSEGFDIPGFDEIPEMGDIPGPDEVPEMGDIPGLDEIPEMGDIPGLVDIPEMEDIIIPEMPEDIEIPVLEEPIAEPDIPVAEPAPASAGFSADPNAMMTPEDIAKLLESMGK